MIQSLFWRHFTCTALVSQDEEIQTILQKSSQRDGEWQTQTTGKLCQGITFQHKYHHNP